MSSPTMSSTSTPPTNPMMNMNMNMGMGMNMGMNMQMGMNMNGKRSGSPSEEELDQLTAMHLLKRQRLAQAAAAAAAEASLFGGPLMEMPMGCGMPGFYNSSFGSAAAAARFRFTGSFNMNHMNNVNASAYNYPSHSLWVNPNPNAVNPQGMPCMPGFAPQQQQQMQQQQQQEGRSPSPAGDTGLGLEQLSAFASHMPAMPLPNNGNGNANGNAMMMRRKSSVDAPATNAHIPILTSSKEDQQLICSPLGADTLPLRTMKLAKKLKMPSVDNNPKAAHWEDRPFAPLAVDEDANWLSEFQCFLRSEILEVFIASPRDLENRAIAGSSKKKIATSQVGIRCRFCAHLHPTERASRASAFPSSVRQIYQSFTMMLREHLNGQCEAFPNDIKAHFAKLKGQSAQSASDSKRYWIYAAQKLGMVDTKESGIQMADHPPTDLKPFGASPELQADLEKTLQEENQEPLVIDDDKAVTAEFIHKVVQQAVKVHLAASEKIGNRSCLSVGLPGLACKHCAQQGRSGLSRVFPARKRNLKTKVQDLYDHLRRCELTPESVKEELKASYCQDSDKKSKVFYARLWKRLGHENDDGKISPSLESQQVAEGTVSPIPSEL